MSSLMAKKQTCAECGGELAGDLPATVCSRCVPTEEVAEGGLAASARPGSIRKADQHSRPHPWALIAGLGLAVGLTWTGYALWQENQILVWREAHPGRFPEPDNATKAFPEWASFFGFLVFFFMEKLPPLRFFERKRRERILTGRKVGVPALAAHALYGLIGVALALYTGMKAIDRYQWLNDPTVLTRTKVELAGRGGPAMSNAGSEFLKPEEPRFTKTALGSFLGLAFLVAALSANVVRKAVEEARFIAYPSRKAEIAAMADAKREQAAAEEASFRVQSQRVSRSALLYFMSFWLLFTLAMLWGWVQEEANSDGMFSFTTLAVLGLAGMAFASAFPFGSRLKMRWRSLAAMCFLGSLGALAVIYARSGETERELMITSAIAGAIPGSILGLMVKNVFEKESIHD